jgi:hypothetical protein
MKFAGLIRMSAATRTVEMRVSQYDWNTLSEEIKGTKGSYRGNLRHGVSRIRSGLRHTIGIAMTLGSLVDIGECPFVADSVAKLDAERLARNIRIQARSS